MSKKHATRNFIVNLLTFIWIACWVAAIWAKGSNEQLFMTGLFALVIGIAVVASEDK